MIKALIAIILTYALANPCLAYTRADLEAAAKSGDLALVQTIMTKQPGMNGISDRSSVLYWAAAAGHEDIVAWVLTNRKPVPGVALNPNTALLAATEAGHVGVMKILLDHGAAVGTIAYGNPSTYGFDPLLIALSEKHYEAAALLIDRGADLNRPTNPDGNSCLSLRYARQHNLPPAFIRLLISHGARDPETDYAYTADPAPILKDEVGMVPAAQFAEWLGAPYVVNLTTGLVTITLNGHTVNLYIGSTITYYGSRETVTLTATPFVKDGAAYIPLRAIIDGLKIATDYDARGLTTTLHHPLTGESLIVALADPDKPATPKNRAELTKGVIPVIEAGFSDILVMRDGKVGDNDHLYQEKTDTFVKYYTTTRYVGALTSFHTKSPTFDKVHLRTDWLMGITGRWNAQPRPLHSDDPTQPRYAKAARELLTSKGIAKEVPLAINQVVRGDLDADNREEVLMVGYYDARPDLTPHSSTPEGTPHPFYSFVGLWRASTDKLTLIDVDGDFDMTQQTNYAWYNLAGVLDFNADGTMEYILASDHYGQDSAYNIRAACRLVGNKVTQAGSCAYGE